MQRRCCAWGQIPRSSGRHRCGGIEALGTPLASFRRRSLCAISGRHAACLRAAYRERIDLLAALAAWPAREVNQPLRLSCPSAPWGSGPVRLMAIDRFTFALEDTGGRVLAVASAQGSCDDWQPFLRLVREPEGIRLDTSDGRAVRCTTLLVS